MTLSFDETSPMSLLFPVFIESYTKNTVQPGKLSLTKAGKTLSTLKDVFLALVEDAGPTAKESSLGKGPGAEAQVIEYLQQAESFQANKETLTALDVALAKVTYLVGNHLTAADAAIYASLHSYMKSAQRESLLSHPNLTRHFDLIQHSTPISSTVLSKHLYDPALIKIDLDNIPKQERKAAPKPDKKKVKAEDAESVSKPQVKEDATEASGKSVESKKEKAPKEKKPAKEKPAASTATTSNTGDGKPMPHMIDLRVGRIIEVKRHPDADTLYVEQIDIGEAEPRTVVSGLVKYIPIEEMQNKILVAVCNLKPANMRGIKSYAMVLAASSKAGKDEGVELVAPPEGSQPGDRVYFEGFENEKALELLNPKKKIFETVQPGFTTLDTREAAWIDPETSQVHKLRTDKGFLKAPTFVGASLS